MEPGAEVSHPGSTLDAETYASFASFSDPDGNSWVLRERAPEMCDEIEPNIVSVQLDGKQLHLEPGQTVIPHGPDRDLNVAEVFPRTQAAVNSHHRGERGDY